MVSIRKGIGISIPKIHIAPCSQIRDGNARQPAASIKRVVTDGSDGVSDGDAIQLGQTICKIRRNPLYTVPDIDGCDVKVIKRPIR